MEAQFGDMAFIFPPSCRECGAEDDLQTLAGFEWCPEHLVWGRVLLAGRDAPEYRAIYDGPPERSPVRFENAKR